MIQTVLKELTKWNSRLGKQKNYMIIFDLNIEISKLDKEIEDIIKYDSHDGVNDLITISSVTRKGLKYAFQLLIQS